MARLEISGSNCIVIAILFMTMTSTANAAIEDDGKHMKQSKEYASIQDVIFEVPIPNGRPIQTNGMEEAKRLEKLGGSRKLGMVRGGRRVAVANTAPPPYSMCKSKKYYVVVNGDKCTAIIFKLYKNDAKLFNSIAGPVNCQSGSPTVGLKLCLP